ncbi:hypothetical protein [Brevundimonas sp.]|uniref:hypothetical protein n=1 Tax=Brevundimonas sp. TaxID=1871086 RepID=UPI003918B40F
MAVKGTTEPTLRVVNAESEVYDLMRKPESTGERVKRLQMEARALAVEQVEMLERLLLEATALSKEIAEGGDAYPVGAREIASRLAADLPTRVETMKQIIGRMPVK